MQIVWTMGAETLLTLWGLILLLLAGSRHTTEADVRLTGQLALVALTSSLVWTVWAWIVSPGGTVGMVALDGFRYAASVLVLGGAILAVLLSFDYVSREGILVPEYYVLIVFATIGMMVMVAAADLVLVFLGIELMSLAVYVLVAINRRSVYGAEGALKYFLLGAFASGFLLYGIALVYGATGTTHLPLIAARIDTLGLVGNPMLLTGVGLLLIGFGFKVAAVPFHMWAPDVYDGAPTPISGFMAAAVKAAGFAVVLRVIVIALAGTEGFWGGIVWWLAAITMVGGNLMALAQRRIKRMLAYSSVGHAGYLLTAVASGTTAAAGAILFYALAYTLMTMGAFAVVAVAGRRGERDLLIDDFAGLGARRPWLALAMAVFMLSLLGFPGTAGFIGKWYVLTSSIEAGQWMLAVVLVMASVASAGYYLPVVMQMYMERPRTEDAHARTRAVGPTRIVVAATAILLLVFGLWPGPALHLARDAGRTLRPAVEFTFAAHE